MGRLIIEYAREATSDPAKVFTAVFAAAALGLVMAGLVALIDLATMRNRPPAEVWNDETADGATMSVAAVEVRALTKTFNSSQTRSTRWLTST